MIKEIKPKKCKLRTCRAEFIPRKSGLSVQKYCNPACELDDAQSIKKVAKPKPKKQKTVGKLRLDLWDQLSLYIKLLYSTDGEWCTCYTCDKPIKIGTIDCQGGHAFSKAANGNLYFDERAVRPQCSYCNCGEEGNHYIFNERLKQEIGLSAWNDMYLNRKKEFKRPRGWYMDQIEYYKKEIEGLRVLRSPAAPIAAKVGGTP